MTEKVNIENLIRTTDEKDRFFLEATYKYAFMHSDDTRTKTAASIERNGIIAMKGTNHFLPNTDHIPDRGSPEKKHLYVIHSERDAIEKAKKHKVAFGLSSMYMFLIPCVPCYNILKDSGIKKLITHRECIERTPERWIKNLNEAIYLAEKDKFPIHMYEGKIGNDTMSLFNGELWEP